MQTAQEAVEFFKQWKGFTGEALAILAPKCPATQIKKVRPWHVEGKGGPQGVIYHYTGGPNGISSVRWANENPQNTGSSWHVTLMDHRYKALEHLLSQYPLVKMYLPVTGLFIASLDKGTWHGNWTNDRTFGIENRNLGRLNSKGYRRKFKSKKAPVQIRGQWWEPYTKGQILANIFVARALRLIQESKGAPFLPEWNLPHSAVWGPGTDKMDTGSAFPMFNVRAAVFEPTFVEEPLWLSQYADHTVVDHEEDEEFATEMMDLQRDTRPPPYIMVDLSTVEDSSWRGHLPWVRWAFQQLGYHVVPGSGNLLSLDSSTALTTGIFQRCTHAKKWKPKHGALKVDGIPGRETIHAIMIALNYFAIDHIDPLKLK